MKDPNCIFCKLANGDIPTNIVYEDEDFAVILDANPATKGHALILPKEHYKNITEAPEDIKSKLMSLASKIGEAQMKVLNAEGFNIVINTNEVAGQTVFHLHVHIIPRYKDDNQDINWKPNSGLNDDEVAKKLKEVL